MSLRAAIAFEEFLREHDLYLLVLPHASGFFPDGPELRVLRDDFCDIGVVDVRNGREPSLEPVRPPVRGLCVLSFLKLFQAFDWPEVIFAVLG